MAKTGPQRYPGASTAYWHQARWGGTAMESNVGVIHTTEGRTVPDYGGGASAPNFTAMPDIPNRRLRWYQHFDFDVSSRALVNKAGGVDTNTANAVQIELVGTCDERKASTWDGKRAGVDYIFWPAAPDWALAELAKFVKWAHDNHGIQLRSTVTWKPYNKGQVGGSYGANGVRLTGAQWNAYYGWLGHQHVPENDHGDPGNLNFARVLAHATGVNPEPAPEEDDMAISDADADKIALRVLGYRNKAANDASIKATGKPIPDVYGYLTQAHTQIAALNASVRVLAGQLGEDVDTETVVAAVERAIANAVVEVNVDVTGPTNS